MVLKSQNFDYTTDSLQNMGMILERQGIKTGKIKIRGWDLRPRYSLTIIAIMLEHLHFLDTYRKNGTILLPKDGEKDVLGIHDDRDDLKITLKIFLSRVDFEQVRQCLDVTFEQLGIDSVEQLIISFPQMQVRCRFVFTGWLWWQHWSQLVSFVSLVKENLAIVNILYWIKTTVESTVNSEF